MKPSRRYSTKPRSKSPRSRLCRFGASTKGGVPNAVGPSAVVGYAGFGQAQVIATTMWILMVTSVVKRCIPAMWIPKGILLVS
jgi:hypothetical protein